MRQINYHFISVGNVAKVWDPRKESYEEAIVTGFYPGNKMVKLQTPCGKALVKSAEDLLF
jgi:hypothetical protein